MPTEKEATVLLQSLESFTQAVRSNPSGWYDLILKLGDNYTCFTEQVTQLRKNEEALETKLDGANARALLAENEKNQAIGVKLHLQEELIATQALVAAAGHSESKSSSSSSKKSAKQADPEKFTGKDKEKLEAWLIGIHTKMRVNADHFVEIGWNEEEVRQAKMLYVISRLDSDALGHIKPNITEEYTVTGFENWQEIVVVIKRVYGKTDPEGSARRKLISLYQTNKKFETFWSEFHRYGKQAKMSDEQILDYLKDRLSREVNERLVNILDMPTELHAYVKKVRQLSLKMQELKEKDSRRPYRGDTQGAQNTQNNTPRFGGGTRLGVPAAKPSNPPAPPHKLPMLRSITAPTSSDTPAVGGTHPGPMDLSSSGKRGPLTQAEKDYRRANNLCNYYRGPGHIAINHHDSAVLSAKKRVYNLRLASAHLIPYYTSITDESAVEVTENEESSS